MKQETLKLIKKVARRIRVPAQRVMRDRSKYRRHPKHKGRQSDG